MDDADERSLDLVQRLVISALLLVVMGAPTVALAAYGAFADSVAPNVALGLCVLSGVIGLLCAAVIHVINRRPPYAPTVILGLLPAAAAAYVIFT